MQSIMVAAFALLTSCNALTAVLCIVGLLAWVPWAINRWRFRHIPGPFAPPVLGNLLGLAQHDLHGYIELCRRKYGKLFKVYIGSNMIICVAEPSLAKRTFTKLMHRHSGIQLVAGSDDWDLLKDGLVGANGQAWRTLRAAWQPAFNSTSLETYVGGINSAAEGLSARLQTAAASGQQVELSSELSSMTLDIVGQAGYGVDLHSLAGGIHEKQHSSKQQADSLLDAIKAVFQGGGVANSSNYLPLVLLFPAVAPLVEFLAYRWPDARLARLAKARAKIKQISMQLVTSWRGSSSSKTQQQQQQQELNDIHSQNGTAAAAVRAATAPAAAVQSGPGTFPSLMLNAKDKDTGEQLSDEQVVSQFNTFIIAAFETTATAVATCIYHIAQHQQVEEQLLQEIDKFGRSRPVAYSDLDQFPMADAILKETLRLLPPGAIAARITQQQHQLTQQVLLPPGTPLFACVHAYQRDPDYWPAAEEFRPERWRQADNNAAAAAASLQPATPDAYSPFGIGPRLCVGMRFANQVVAITLVRLYQRFTFELQPCQVPLPMKQTFALIPANGLRVLVHSRD